MPDLVRDRSKQLLGGMYRAEIIAAVNEIGDRPFTLFTLEDELACTGVRVPPSVLHKEVTILLSCDLLDRHGRNETGHYVYTRRRWDAFWSTMARLVQLQLPEDYCAEVVPLRS